MKPIIVLLWSICALAAHVASQQIPTPKEIHARLFRAKRAEQLEAVKTILNVGHPKKQDHILVTLASTISKVLAESRTSIEKIGFVPGSPFPDDKNAQELISLILENAAFFSDLALRLPDQIHKIYSTDKQLQFLIPWAMHFSIFSDLLDEASSKAIDLAQQELGLVERAADYTNPYRTKTIRELNDMEYEFRSKKMQEKEAMKVKRKKEKKKKGPGLSGGKREL